MIKHSQPPLSISAISLNFGQQLLDPIQTHDSGLRMVAAFIFLGAQILNLFACVFHLHQAEGSRGAFEEMSKLAKVFEIFGFSVQP